jgi:hypothetical protein
MSTETPDPSAVADPEPRKADAASTVPADRAASSPPAAPRKKRARLGAWSFILGILLIAWILGGLYLAALGVSGSHARISGLLPVIVGTSAIVVPLLSLFTLLFGILALALNRAIGKVFGALGIIILLSLAATIFFAVGWIASLHIGLF